MFTEDIQCQLYELLIIQKINIVYIGGWGVEESLERLAKKVLQFPRIATNLINFEKKKMLLLTKRAKITPRCKGMLNLWEKILKKVF